MNGIGACKTHLATALGVALRSAREARALHDDRRDAADADCLQSGN